MTDPLSLRNRTVGLAVGSETPVTFYREGESQTVKVTITERPEDLALHPLGFRLREPSPDETGQPRGMLVIDQVVPGSPAFKAGLRPGMRILAVGQTPVHTKAEFDKAAAPLRAGRAAPLASRSARTRSPRSSSATLDDAIGRAHRARRVATAATADRPTRSPDASPQVDARPPHDRQCRDAHLDLDTWFAETT